MKKWILALAVLGALLLGQKVSAADTTAAAAPKGMETTLKGTLVDVNCYLKEGDTNDDHDDMKGCGKTCLRQGLPAGLLVGDKLYLLIFPSDTFMDYVGKTVEVKGTVYNGNLLFPGKASVGTGSDKKSINLKGKVMM